MIICHQHQIVFLHIPKCGGTSVREVLRPLHDDDPVWNTIGRQTHPELGKIAYDHLPLWALEDHFPKVYDTIKNYRCFAVMRDPRSRFVSSVSEYLKVFRGVNPSDLTPRAFAMGAEEACAYLAAHDRIREHLFIHFEKQVNYIVNDNERIVGRLYTIDHIDEMIREIEKLTGDVIGDGAVMRLNKSRVARSSYSNALVRLLRPALGRFARIVIPGRVQSYIRNRLYAPVDSVKIWASMPAGIRDFVMDYYSEDRKLYLQIAGRK